MGENNQVKTLEEQVNQDVSHEDITVEELDNLTNEILYEPPYIENLHKLDGFKESVKEYSRFAGAFATLVSAGMTTAQAWEFVLNNETNKVSLEISKLTSESKKLESQSNSF